MKRQILHSDMNNFYATVECMLNPALKGKPLAVCGAEEDRSGIVLARNYEAKAYGVTTADVIWQAKQKCPQLVIVPPHYDQYLKFSLLAKEIYNQYTQQVESYGMDECWLDVTGSKVGDGYQIATEIKDRIKTELGLTVSIGVSFNKIFAKLGSDLKKPDAITQIKEETFREQLWHLPASSLLGVGRATEKKLDRYYINTIGKLAQTSDDFLKRLLGKNGLALKRFANGQDSSPVADMNHSIPMKTIGHGITAAADLSHPSEVWCFILALAQDLGEKLRNYKKQALGISLTIKDCNLYAKQWQKKLQLPTQSPTTIAKESFALFQSSYPWQANIRAITVRAIYLEEQDTPHQFNLFTDYKTIEKQETIDKTIHQIRTRFGKNAIYNACLLRREKIPAFEESELVMPTGFMNFL